jgi:CRISPR/Cas system CMR-associated protein Cmr1 (group 7 of RAMP superfamily)
MEDQKRIEELLEQIRDAQRESLDEYKRVTSQSLELQRRAVKRQEQLGKTYRIALIASAALIIGIVGLIVYLLQYLPARYR